MNEWMSIRDDDEDHHDYDRRDDYTHDIDDDIDDGDNKTGDQFRWFRWQVISMRPLLQFWH